MSETEVSVDIVYSSQDMGELIAADLWDRFGVVAPKGTITPPNKTTIKLKGDAAEQYYRHKYQPKDRDTPKEIIKDCKDIGEYRRRLKIIYYNNVFLNENRIWTAMPGNFDDFGELYKEILFRDSSIDSPDFSISREESEKKLGMKIDETFGGVDGFGDPIRYCQSNTFKEVLSNNRLRIHDPMLDKAMGYIRTSLIGTVFPIGLFYYKSTKRTR